MMIGLTSSNRSELRNAGWTNVMVDKYCDYVTRRSIILRRGRSSYKDSEMTKVYNAEFAFLADLRKAEIEVKQFSNYDEALKTLRRIESSKTWQELNNGSDQITLIEKRDMGFRSRSAGLATYGRITLCPRYGYNLYTLLHEMAHCAGHLHHDVSFRQTLIRLVSRFIGVRAAELLKKQFKKAGLRMHIKSNIMGPEEWLAGYNKMVAARSKIAF